MSENFPQSIMILVIERGSGTAYDTAVAEACLRLFREKGYVLPS